jgi:hypothetical protein
MVSGAVWRELGTNVKVLDPVVTNPSKSVSVHAAVNI